MLEMEEELENFYPEDEIIKLYKEEIMKLKSDADFVRMLTNDQEQELYENTIREESYKDGRAEGRIEGLADGIAQNNQENAKKMKENGIPYDLISKITGLSKKQIMML